MHKTKKKKKKKSHLTAQIESERLCTVIHFYFGADLISVILVQAFFTEIKSLPKF